MTRAKDNMTCRAVKNLTKGHENIVKDQIVALQGKQKGLRVRRVEAWVEVDGDWRLMVFLTNNLAWSPRSACDLYRRRWDIEVLLPRWRSPLRGCLRQAVSLRSAQAGQAEPEALRLPRAQRQRGALAGLRGVAGLRVLRCMAHLEEWGHSFTRLFAASRSALWERIDLLALLKSYGTASGRMRVVGALQDAWLPGLEPTRR